MLGSGMRLFAAAVAAAALAGLVAASPASDWEREGGKTLKPKVMILDMVSV